MERDQFADIPQEVLDLIVDSADVEDIRSLSLTCRACTARAQRHWFYTVTITRASHRSSLLRLLNESTHVAQYVKVFCLHDIADTYPDDVLHDLRLHAIFTLLPNISSISLGSGDEDHSIKFTPFTEEFQSSLVAVLRRPLVETFSMKMLGRVPSSYLHCSLDLKELVLVGVKHHQEFLFGTTPVRNGGVRLQALTMKGCWGMPLMMVIKSFIYDADVINFSSLRSLHVQEDKASPKYTSSYYVPFANLLRACSPTLERLHFEPSKKSRAHRRTPDADPLSLPDLPALRELSLGYLVVSSDDLMSGSYYDPFPWVCHVLQLISSPFLTTLWLSFRMRTSSAAPEHHFADGLDTLNHTISSPSFAALSLLSIRFEIAPWAEDSFVSENYSQIVHEKITALDERSVRISFH